MDDTPGITLGRSGHTPNHIPRLEPEAYTIPKTTVMSFRFHVPCTCRARQDCTSASLQGPEDDSAAASAQAKPRRAPPVSMATLLLADPTPHIEDSLLNAAKQVGCTGAYTGPGDQPC
jgi:hypothetical protein